MAKQLSFIGTASLAAGIALSACADNQPLVNFDTARAGAGDYIYVHGGYYDGAAAGQETTFVITPDDRLRCIFESKMHIVQQGDQNEDSQVSVNSFDEPLPGAYAALLKAVGGSTKDGTEPEKSAGGNFLIEISQGGVRRWALLNSNDQGFDALVGFFSEMEHQAKTTPTYRGCWAFG